MSPENAESRPRPEDGSHENHTDASQDTADDSDVVILEALKKLPQWVVWRYEDDLEGKPTKVLYNPAAGRKASTTNPSTWASYDEAKQALTTSEGRWDGIGFVFTKDDPFCGLDFDKCIKDGVLHPYVRAAVKKLDSYTEISPSGTGLHVIVKAKLNGDRNSTNDTPWGGKFEVYDHSRFFTMTGQGRAGNRDDE